MEMFPDYSDYIRYVKKEAMRPALLDEETIELCEMDRKVSFGMKKSLSLWGNASSPSPFVTKYWSSHDDDCTQNLKYHRGLRDKGTSWILSSFFLHSMHLYGLLCLWMSSDGEKSTSVIHKRCYWSSSARLSFSLLSIIWLDWGLCWVYIIWAKGYPQE